MNCRRLYVVFVASICAMDARAADKMPADTSPPSQAIIDFGVERVPIITKPGKQYTNAELDYAMVIGIDRTPKGRLWAAWVAGGDSEKGFFCAATSDDDGNTWSEPRLVIDPVDAPNGLARRALVGNFWTDPTGRLWLFYDQSLGYFDGRAGVWAITCDNPDDAEPLWSMPRRLANGATLNKPTVLKDGTWLLPVSLWTRRRIGPAPLRELFHELDAERMAHVYESTDQGATWKRRGGVLFPQSQFDEHMFVELKDGRLWMLARTDFGIAESYSSDAGRTWSEPQPSSIAHVCSRFHLRRLASGRLLLVKHGKIDERTPKRSHLSAYVSDDEGKTWQGGLMIDERTGVSYPDGFQHPDGAYYIVYDHNRGSDREILLARFKEEDILAGKFVSPRAAEQIMVHKALGGLKSAGAKAP